MDRLQMWYAWAEGQHVSISLLQVLYVLLAFVTVGIILDCRYRRSSWRGKLTRMDKNSRRRKEQVVVADIIEDGFSEAVEDNLLTAAEAKFWKELIGSRVNLPDLLPKNRFKPERPDIIRHRQEVLKSRILLKRSIGIEKPVALPGDPDNPARTPALKSLADMLKRA